MLSLAITAGAVSAGSSLAEENKTLPGVKQPDGLVTTPLPEPDQTVEPSRPNTFRIGNTDVTISGSVTVDVGTFKPSKR